jgi:hypothetical protein
MKQAKIKFGKSEADAIGKFLAEQGIVTTLSWMENTGVFSYEIFAIVTFPTEKADLFEAKMHKYIV